MGRGEYLSHIDCNQSRTNLKLLQIPEISSLDTQDVPPSDKRFLSGTTLVLSSGVQNRANVEVLEPDLTDLPVLMRMEVAGVAAAIIALVLLVESWLEGGTNARGSFLDMPTCLERIPNDVTYFGKIGGV